MEEVVHHLEDQECELHEWTVEMGLHKMSQQEEVVAAVALRLVEVEAELLLVMVMEVEAVLYLMAVEKRGFHEVEMEAREVKVAL